MKADAPECAKDGQSGVAVLTRTGEFCRVARLICAGGVEEADEEFEDTCLVCANACVNARHLSRIRA
jgi:hypothetical protein